MGQRDPSPRLCFWVRQNVGFAPKKHELYVVTPSFDCFFMGFLGDAALGFKSTVVSDILIFIA